MEGNITRQNTVNVTVCVFARKKFEQLRTIVEELGTLFRSRGLSYEFVVVASGKESEGGESAIAQFQAASSDDRHRVGVFRIFRDVGNAECIKTVEDHIHGDIVITVETGGQLIVNDADALLARLSEGVDFVNGVRSWKGEPVINKWQSKLFNWCARVLTGSHVHDLNSTIKVFRRSVLKTVPLYGDFYRFLPALAERKGFRVSEVQVARREEQKTGKVYGPASYVRRFLDIVNLVFVTRFTEKPLRFFGGLGTALLVAGILINLWLTVERTVFHMGMADRPMLLFGILLMVVGVQSISLGLLGEMIVYSRTKDVMDSEVERLL